MVDTLTSDVMGHVLYYHCRRLIPFAGKPVCEATWSRVAVWSIFLVIPSEYEELFHQWLRGLMGVAPLVTDPLPDKMNHVLGMVADCLIAGAKRLWRVSRVSRHWQALVEPHWRTLHQVVHAFASLKMGRRLLHHTNCRPTFHPLGDVVLHYTNEWL